MAKVSDTVVLHRPVLLENTQAGPTVFSDEVTGVSVTWEGCDDPMGNNIQAVPISFLENINFLRVLNRGVLTVFDADDDIKKMIQSQLETPHLKRQAAAWRAQRSEQTAQTAISIEHVEKNDYVIETCIGPSTRGRAACGAEVPVRERERGQKPPLCANHVGLASEFVSTETDEMVDGKAISKWIPVKIESLR